MSRPTAPKAKATAPRTTGAPLEGDVYPKLAGFLMLVLAAEIGAAVYSSPILDIRRVDIRVDGGATAAERRVVSAACDIRPGTSLVAFPAGKVEEGLGRLAWVQRAAVSRDKPDAIRVTVVSREAVAVLVGPAGRWEIDKNGHAVRPARSDVTLPLVRLASEWEPTPGRRIGGTAMDAALTVLARAPHLVQVSIRTVTVDRNVDVWLTTSDSVEFRLGQPDNLPDKMARMVRLYSINRRLGRLLRVVDLRSLKSLSCIERAPDSGKSAGLSTGQI